MSTLHIAPYSPRWPLAFAHLRERVLRAFAEETATVEHIGSTAVPGLSAKPVIDMLLGAPSLAAIEARIAALADWGFDYVSRHEHALPERRYFVAQPPGGLRVHLHGVVRDGPLWRAHMTFRDALRADAGLRARYQSLKLRLAAEHADDKAAYTEAKGPFIREVLAGLGTAERAAAG